MIKKRQKIKALSIIVIIAMLFLSACQPTPEKPVVVGKGEKQIDNMLEKAVATPDKSNIKKQADTPNMPASTYQAPKRLEYSLHSEITGGIITVDIDASVIVPEYALPIVSVKPKDITYEQIEPIVNLFVGDKPLYHSIYAGRITTKSDIQYRIDRYMWEIAMCGDDSNMQKLKKNYQERIKGLYKEMEIAPETLAEADLQPDSPKTDNVIKDVGVTPMPVRQLHEGELLTEDMIGPIKITEENYNKKYYQLVIGEDAGADNLSLNTNFDSERGQIMQYRYRTAEIAGNSVSDRIIPDIMSGFSMSEDDAIKIAKPFADAIDPMLVITDVGEAVATDFSEDDNPNFPFGYTLYYAKVYNGVNTSYAEPFTLNRDILAATGELGVYQKPYPQEYLIITVGIDGIYSLIYNSPMQLVETLATDVTLLPFKEIQDKFDEYIVLNSIDPSTEIYMKINRVELGMMRIAQPNSDEYLVIPVWDFYGGSIMPSTSGMLSDEQKSQIAEFYGRSFLTINAIDGSIIDRELGY